MFGVAAEFFQMLDRIGIVIHFNVATTSVEAGQVSRFGTAILADDLEETHRLAIAIQSRIDWIFTIVIFCFK